jgi:hypothetical protein
VFINLSTKVVIEMSDSSDRNTDEGLAEQVVNELTAKAKHNPDTGAGEHYCPVHGWYPATSTAHEGH